MTVAREGRDEEEHKTILLAAVIASILTNVAKAQDSIPIRQVTDQEVDRAIKTCTAGLRQREASINIALEVLKRHIVTGQGGIASSSASTVIPQLSTNDALEAFLAIQTCIKVYLTPPIPTPPPPPTPTADICTHPKNPAVSAGGRAMSGDCTFNSPTLNNIPIGLPSDNLSPKQVAGKFCNYLGFPSEIGDYPASVHLAAGRSIDLITSVVDERRDRWVFAYITCQHE